MRGTVFVLLAVALGTSGCGSGGNPEMVRTGTPTVTVRADGTLSANPALLTLDDINRQSAGTPRRAVLEQLFWAQWGSWPDIFEGYAPTIGTLVGRENLTGAYAILRAQLTASKPRFVATRVTNGRATIQLELLTATGAPTHETFVLRRLGGRWLIISDTLLERGLKTYVTQRFDGDIATETPTRRAVRAGIEAAARFRAAFDKPATTPQSTEQRSTTP